MHKAAVIITVDKDVLGVGIDMALEETASQLCD